MRLLKNDKRPVEREGGHESIHFYYLDRITFGLAQITIFQLLNYCTHVNVIYLKQPLTKYKKKKTTMLVIIKKCIPK